jgi:energy-coupling factor transport system permease protein
MENGTMYIKVDSLFDRIDPLSKLIWGTLMMLWTFYVAVPGNQIILFVCLLFIGRFGAKIGFLKLIKSVRTFLALGLFMIVFQALVAKGTTVIWTWGALTATAEGLSAGLNVGLRLIVIVTISSILAITTDPRRLVVSLIEHARVPYRFAYAVYSTLRFIPLMSHDANVIIEAQTIRGARTSRSIWARMKQYLGLLIPLIADGIRQATTAAIAIDSRAFGYKDTRTNLLEVDLPATGPILVILTLVLFVLYIIFGSRAKIGLLY